VSSLVKLDDLTKREREIVALICRGAGDAEISKELTSCTTMSGTNLLRSTGSLALTGEARS
jgi:FixJ family two-component response regulator